MGSVHRCSSGSARGRLRAARAMLPFTRPWVRSISSRSPQALLHPLEGRIESGFWADRQRLNRERLLPDGEHWLEEAGNFENLRAAAGRSDAAFRGMVFMDSDVHKWLEALGWELGREPSEDLARRADAAIELVEAAQEDGGYLNSYYQVARPGARFANLAWDHELYCAGHLIQAGDRARARPRRRAAARRGAPLRRPHRRRVRPDRRDGTPGHPEIETRARRAVPPDRRAALPRPGRATSSTRRGHGDAAAGALRLELLPGPRAGARGRPRSPATRCARSTSPPASPTSTSRPARRALLDAMRAQWRDMAAPQDLRHRRGRRASLRRGVRRPVRAAARPLLRRDLRRDRLVHVELADAAGHRRGALRRLDGAHALQRLPRRAWRWTAAATPTSTRCTCATTTATPSSAARGGCRGSPAPAARRT